MTLRLVVLALVALALTGCGVVSAAGTAVDLGVGAASLAVDGASAVADAVFSDSDDEDQ